MAKPTISKRAKQSLRNAVRVGAILKGQSARVQLVAEAIARVEQGRVESKNPEAIALKTIPDEALTEALSIVATGGIYDAYKAASGEEKKRLRSVIGLISDACEAYSCTATRVCRTPKQVFAPRGCDPLLQVSRLRLRSGVEGWAGAPTKVDYQHPSGLGTIDCRFALLPISGVKASHDALREFRPTKGYPLMLQERDYSLPAEKQKIRTATDPKKFRPQALLGNTQTALVGPPIIDMDGYVLGGNGRTMIMQYHEAHGSTAYRNALLQELRCNTCYGLEGAPVEGNILVRVIEGDSDRPRISSLLNTLLTAPVDRAAGAITLGSQLSDQVLHSLAKALAEDGATFESAVASLGARLVEKLEINEVINPTNRSGWVETDAKGNLILSSTGVKRFKEAITRELVGDSAPNGLTRYYAHIAPGLLLLSRRGIDLVSELRAAPEIHEAHSSTQELANRYFLKPTEKSKRLLYGPPSQAALLVWLRDRSATEAAQDIIEMLKSGERVGIATDEEVLEAGGPAGYLRAYIERKAPKAKLPSRQPPALPDGGEWDEDEDEEGEWDEDEEEDEELEEADKDDDVPCDVESTPDGYVRGFFGQDALDDLEGAGFELCWVTDCPEMSEQTRKDVGALLMGRSSKFKLLPAKQRVEAAVRALLRCGISVLSSLDDIAVEKAELKRKKKALKRDMKRKKKELEKREEQLEDKIEDAEEEVEEVEESKGTAPPLPPDPEDYPPGEKLLKLPRLGRTARDRLRDDLGISTSRDLWLKLQSEPEMVLHVRGISKRMLEAWHEALDAEAEQHGWRDILGGPGSDAPDIRETLDRYSVGDEVLLEDEEGRHVIEATVVQLLAGNDELPDRALVETETAVVAPRARNPQLSKEHLMALMYLVKPAEDGDEDEDEDELLQDYSDLDKGEDDDEDEEDWRDLDDEELPAENCDADLPFKGFKKCDTIGPFSNGDRVIADVRGERYQGKVLYLMARNDGKNPKAKIEFTGSARGDETVDLRNLTKL